MSKKLNSLEALANIQFKNLAPNPEPLTDNTPKLMNQELN